jgi:uncharacterized membrane protein YoaK (UPF0700 family)
MTTEAKHHISGSLLLAAVLAATAGFVDAYVDTRVTPVFVANMSGNLIRLGIFAGQHSGAGVASAGTALAGFLLGIVAATNHLDGHVRAGRTLTSASLLRFEATLLIALPVILLLDDHKYSAKIAGIDYVVVVIAATAMGIQAVALRRVGEVAVSTTYGTGAVVRLGEKIALAVRGAARPGDARRRVTVAVLGIVLLSYVGGAALAASIGSSAALLFIPAGVALTAAVILSHGGRTTSRSKPPRDPPVRRRHGPQDRSRRSDGESGHRGR